VISKSWKLKHEKYNYEKHRIELGAKISESIHKGLIKAPNLKDMLSEEMSESLIEQSKAKIDENTDIIEDEVKIELVPESYFTIGNVKL